MLLWHCTETIENYPCVTDSYMFTQDKIPELFFLLQLDAVNQNGACFSFPFLIWTDRVNYNVRLFRSL